MQPVFPLRTITRLANGVADALAGLRVGGEVFASFPSTLTVRACNGRLLVLHGPGVPETPFSAILDMAPLTWPRQGARTSARHDALVIDGQPFARGTRIVPAPEWPRRWDGPPTRPQDKEFACTRTAVLARTLRPWASGSSFGRWWEDEDTEPSDGSVGTRVQQIGAAHLRRLVDGLRAQDSDRVRGAMEGLLGLGPGLTPSGDDALLGLGAAWLGGSTPDLPCEARQFALDLLATSCATRTTVLSSEFFYHLRRGRLSAPVEALITAIQHFPASQPDPLAPIEQAAAYLATCGHSSGRDTIAGIVAFLYAAQPAPPPWSPGGNRDG